MSLSAVLLTGGQATRMYPLSVSSSKAMLPFFDRPILARLMDDLKLARVTDVWFTSRGVNDDIADAFRSPDSSGVSYNYPEFRRWYGSAGAVRALLQASTEVSDPFIVVYGDSLLQIDCQALVAYHREKSAAATIAYHRADFSAFLLEPVGSIDERPRTNFGVLETDADGRVTCFEEKTYLDEIDTRFRNPVANAAVYVLSRDAVMAFPAADENIDFGFHVLPWMVESGLRVFGFNVHPGYRVDLGTLSNYLAAHLAVLKGELGGIVRPGLISFDGHNVATSAHIHHPVHIAAGVAVGEGAYLESSVLGRNVAVGAQCKIVNSVLLEGTSVGRGCTVEDSIIGRYSRVAEGMAVPRHSVVGPWSRLGGAHLGGDTRFRKGLFGIIEAEHQRRQS